MQRLITCLLILYFVPPCLCVKRIIGVENIFYNVMDYGAYGDGINDDSQAFIRAWQYTCGTQGTSILVIPSNKVFLVTNIVFKGPCNTTEIYIQFQGKVVAPPMHAWVSDYKSALMLISNVNGVTIDGSGGGQIDGYGSTWWECKSCLRPKVLGFNSCYDLTVSYLSIINSPKAHISIVRCKRATFSHIYIHAPGDSPNTDGFDISSSNNILITDSIIESGDDCIAIGNGSSYINATGIACSFGHGISIGSLGRYGGYDTVEEVYVQNCNFTKTKYGARIKTWPGGTGYARQITFENITLIEARYPIIIDQFYNSFELIAVEVSEVTYRGFQGTSAIGKAIDLYCSSTGCFNIVLDQINIVSSQPGKSAYAFCNNAHGTATYTVPNVSCLLT